MLSVSPVGLEPRSRRLEALRSGTAGGIIVEPDAEDVPLIDLLGGQGQAWPRDPRDPRDPRERGQVGNLFPLLGGSFHHPASEF